MHSAPQPRTHARAHTRKRTSTRDTPTRAKEKARARPTYAHTSNAPAASPARPGLRVRRAVWSSIGVPAAGNSFGVPAQPRTAELQQVARE
eukprot:6311138-Prymnesium_polylepis.1